MIRTYLFKSSAVISLFLCIQAISTKPARSYEASASKEMEASWKKAEKQNTQDFYAKFVGQFPDSPHTPDAKMRIANPDYAFIATCLLGTKHAVDGFLRSFPADKRIEMVNYYRAFIDKVGINANLKKIDAFLASNPNNPFAVTARSLVPIRWLKDTKAKVGLLININATADKGVLNKLKGEDQIRQALWTRYKSILDLQDIPAALVETPDPSTTPGVTYLITLNYSEINSAPTAQDATLAGALANALYRSFEEIISITITRSGSNAVIYNDISALTFFTTNMNLEEIGKDSHLSRDELLICRLLSRQDNAKTIFDEYTSVP